jgi:hypothetical protein
MMANHHVYIFCIVGGSELFDLTFDVRSFSFILNNKEKYKMTSTKDIYLAAAFLAVGAKHENTDKSDKRHMEFKFSAPVAKFETGALKDIPAISLEQVESDWINGTLMVNAVAYKDAIQRLKGVIHST